MVVLAVVQGITEFLPISSSAHLILVPHFLGWDDQGLGFDLAMHLGTLVAVLAYFRTDVASLWQAWVQSMTARRRDSEVAMAWGLILATVPAIVFGGIIGLMGEEMLRVPGIIATTSIVFGLLLGWVDMRAPCKREPEQLGWRAVVRSVKENEFSLSISNGEDLSIIITCIKIIVVLGFEKVSAHCTNFSSILLPDTATSILSL